jgi:hypothetical protein
MCVNCLSKVDVAAASLGFGIYVLKEPVKEGLRAAGLLPEAHPLAVQMRTVNFLRDLDLDPVAILGAETVAAVDVAQAFPRQTVYRRSFADLLRLVLPGSGSRRSQMVYATK